MFILLYMYFPIYIDICYESNAYKYIPKKCMSYEREAKYLTLISNVNGFKIK